MNVNVSRAGAFAVQESGLFRETSALRRVLHGQNSETPIVRELRATITAGCRLHPIHSQVCPWCISRGLT